MKNENTEEKQTTPGFPKKWAKRLPDGVSEQLQQMSDDELRKKIVQWQQLISQTEKDMSNDPKLESLKEEIKDKSSVYKETLVVANAQMRFAAYVLEGRGK